MHILVIPSLYPIYDGDFFGSFCREQVLAFKKTYPEIQVGVSYTHFYSLKAMGKKLRIDCDDNQVNTVIHSHLSPPRMRRLNIKRHIKCALNLYNIYIKKYGKPNLVHVHAAWPAGLVALEIFRQHGIPYVVTEHSSNFAKNVYTPWHLKHIEAIFQHAKASIAVSHSFADLLKSTFSLPFAYIPNSVNEKFLATPLADTHLSSSALVFLSVATLSDKKGFELLIEAFAKKFSNNPEVQLKIGGDGPLKTKLITLVEHLGIQNQVQFLGRLGRSEVQAQMLLADAFVLPSLYETFGVVYVEALASGLPVIATRCGGPESIVTQEVGYLVETGNLEEIAHAMGSLYESRSMWRENKEHLRLYCKERFSHTAVAMQYRRIYSEALSCMSPEKNEA
ncbi:MAG: glycosyltransferase [Legionellaceae bacterium]|nr:glycosyltransferase [Legionellaceae bacterium]